MFLNSFLAIVNNSVGGTHLDHRVRTVASVYSFLFWFVVSKPYNIFTISICPFVFTHRRVISAKFQNSLCRTQNLKNRQILRLPPLAPVLYNLKMSFLQPNS